MMRNSLRKRGNRRQRGGLIYKFFYLLVNLSYKIKLNMTLKIGMMIHQILKRDEEGFGITLFVYNSSMTNHKFFRTFDDHVFEISFIETIGKQRYLSV